MNCRVENETLTYKQKEALKALRQKLADNWCADYDTNAFLLRWLRARRYDVDAAHNMIRENTVWRTNNGIDSIVDSYEPPEVLKKHYPGGFCGHDLHGCPLYVDPIGLCDVRGLAKSATKEQIIRHKMFQFEYTTKILLPQRSVEESRTVSQVVLIFDLAGVGPQHMWKPSLDLLCEILTMAENNYPETMRKGFIINAPLIFPIIFRLVKRFVGEDTIKKVEIVGKNYKSLLLQEFDVQHLPAKYGGSMTDSNGDVSCSEYICYGGLIPANFYCTALTMDETKEMVVSRRSGVFIKYVIHLPNTIILCEFRTEDYDIAVGVFYNSGVASDGEVPLIPLNRVNSHVEKQSIEVTCAKAGTCFIHFDNSYSWLRDKKVSFVLYGGIDKNNLRVINEEGFREVT